MSEKKGKLTILFAFFCGICKFCALSFCLVCVCVEHVVCLVCCMRTGHAEYHLNE